MDFRPMIFREAHEGEDIRFGLVHVGGELRHFGTQLMATWRHCLLAASASSWTKAIPINAATTRRPWRPA